MPFGTGSLPVLLGWPWLKCREIQPQRHDHLRQNPRRHQGGLLQTPQYVLHPAGSKGHHCLCRFLFSLYSPQSSVKKGGYTPIRKRHHIHNYAQPSTIVLWNLLDEMASPIVVVFHPIRFFFGSLYPHPQNVALAKHIPEMIRFIHVVILPMDLTGVIHHFGSDYISFKKNS